MNLGRARSGSRVDFRRILWQTETLGEFRYVKSTPFEPGSEVAGQLAMFR